MLLYIVVGIATVALLALLAAVISGSLVVGWITVAVSAVGLVLLAVNEVIQRARGDAEPEPEDLTVRTQLAPATAPLQPDIWPPEHPAQDAESDEVETKSDRATLRPDIWP